MFFKILFYIIILVGPASQVSAVSKIEEGKKAVLSAKWAEGKRIADYSLIDQDGKPFNLRERLDKPLLLTYIYTTCPDICTTIVQNLVPAVEETQKEFGNTFNTIVLSFDYETDDPETLKEYAKYFGVDFNTITFATGDKENIERLTKDFGFFYKPNQDGGFTHMSLVSIVNKRGVIYKQVFGINIKTDDIKTPIEQLLTGKIPVKGPPTLIEQIKSICYTYDSQTGTYVLDWPAIVGYGIQTTIMMILFFGIFGRNIIDFIKRRVFNKPVSS